MHEPHPHRHRDLSEEHFPSPFLPVHGLAVAAAAATAAVAAAAAAAAAAVVAAAAATAAAAAAAAAAMSDFPSRSPPLEVFHARKTGTTGTY